MSNLNGFSVSIPEAREETNDGYVILRHAQQFRLQLRNTHKFEGKCIPCDAEVYIQNRLQGTWRIPAGQTILLERSAQDDGKFTAYKNDTLEARQAGINKDSYENGLIKVVFRPGKVKPALVKALPYVPCTWPKWPYNEPWTITYDNNYYNNAHKYVTDNNTTSAPKTRSYSNSFTSSCCSEGNHYLTESCHEVGNLVGGGVGLSGQSNQTFNEVEALDHIEQATTIYLRIAFRDEEPRPLTKVYKVSSGIPKPLR